MFALKTPLKISKVRNPVHRYGARVSLNKAMAAAVQFIEYVTASMSRRYC